MYHVLFVICIYIPISCIAFEIKYYSQTRFMRIFVFVFHILSIIHNLKIVIHYYILFKFEHKYVLMFLCNYNINILLYGLIYVKLTFNLQACTTIINSKIHAIVVMLGSVLLIYLVICDVILCVFTFVEVPQYV
jgi:hypothetical protein